MAKVVYPVEVFDKQENGTIFYKDGALNDELRNMGPGILESWRYNFDAGKQVFRAEGQGQNKGVIYEKRLTKDQNGNPYWSGWMEIPEGEVKGVLAIAVNDGPLRLPNSDGAFKLVITPEVLGVLNKDDAMGLMDQKIAQHWAKTHQYVPWPSSDPTFSQGHKWALDEYARTTTGTPGGEEKILYILQAKKHVDDFATQWLWAPNAAGKFDWVQISGGDALEAWVSQERFNAHELEFKLHEADDDIHVTPDERDFWNSHEDRIDEVEREAAENLAEHTDDSVVHIADDERKAWNAKADQVDFEDHVTDKAAIQPDGSTNELKRRHVDAADRTRWDAKMDGTMPNADKRYVGRLGVWDEAFEQVQLAGAEKKETVFNKASAFNVSAQQFLIPYSGTYGSFEAAFNAVIGAMKGNIDRVVLRMGSFQTFGLDGWFHTEVLGRHSPKFNDAYSGEFVWDMGATPFRNLYVEFSAPITGAKPFLGGITIEVFYRTKDMVLFGDPNKELPINLIGPGDSSNLLYNGTPIAGLGETKWGEIVPKIGGSILDQHDLIKLIEDSVSDRLEVPSMVDDHHWVLTHGDVWTKSLIQPTDVSTDTKEVAFRNIRTVYSGNPIKDNLMSTFFDHLEPGYALIATKVTMKRVTADSDSNGIYFEAQLKDGTMVNRSPIIDVDDGTVVAWEWTIPLVKFDKIVVKARRTNSVQAMAFCDDLIIQAFTSSYDNVQVSLPDKVTNVEGKEIHLNTAKLTIGTKDITIDGTPVKDFFWRYLNAGEVAQDLNHLSREWQWPSRKI